MITVLRPFEDSTGARIGYSFWCPGCNEYHAYYTAHSELRKQGPCWQFDGDMQKPTFSPSLLNTWTHGENNEPRRCHLFLKNGLLEFCGDCTHSLAGKTVPLPPWDEEVERT